MSIFEGKTPEQARNEVSLSLSQNVSSFINQYSSIIISSLDLQKVYFCLHNWIHLLADCTDNQFCLGETAQSGYLRFLCITHLDDVFGLHEG